jgi:geranylgeranyl diphosphate synthase type II
MLSFDLTSWSNACRDELDIWLSARLEPPGHRALSSPCATRCSGAASGCGPLLAFAACEAVGGDRAAALPAGAAVELVHTYSLVHDDLPAMDDDDERRGRPTVHIAFGEATAILAGDALLTEAFTLLARAELSAEVRIALVEQLSVAAGYRGMVGGQAGDMGLGGPVRDLETLMRVHRHKTGDLIRAAVVMGGLVGGATPAQSCGAGQATARRSGWRSSSRTTCSTPTRTPATTVRPATSACSASRRRSAAPGPGRRGRARRRRPAASGGPARPWPGSPSRANV